MIQLKSLAEAKLKKYRSISPMTIKLRWKVEVNPLKVAFTYFLDSNS